MAQFLKCCAKVALKATAATAVIAPVTVLADHWWFDGKRATNKFTHVADNTLVPYHRNFMQLQQHQMDTTNFDTVIPFQPPKSRSEQIAALKQEQFDVLVVGGGISGTASAHEATTRGLKVALVEKGDFASCTSSRSTKLIHGGVRYLEQAFTQFQPELLSLVAEALRERTHMIDSCGYMNEPLPIIIPLSKWWEVPYMGVGVLLYDLIASFQIFPRGYVIGREEAKKKFPQLDADKLDMKAALVYFDGQMNDARHTLALALSAEQKGARVGNYLEVVGLQHDANGKIISAMVRDTLDPDSDAFLVNCKAIINTAGPYADKIRQMDDPTAPELIVPSAGVHVVLPKEVAPTDTGMLIPKTPDGRVLFLLPWEDKVLAGTTDAASDICDVPLPPQEDVKYIVDIVNQYLETPIKESDVQSVWSGLRPLVKDPAHLDATTSKLSRNHLVWPTKSNLISLMGGKYTTHRQMAEDTVDVLLKNDEYFVAQSQAANDDFNKFKKISNTYGKPIYGQGELFHKFEDFSALRPVLQQVYHMDADTSDYYARNYGERSLGIAKNAYLQCLTPTQQQEKENLTPIAKDCLMKSEIKYNIQYEMAQRAEDVLFRRTRLGFVDTKATQALAPAVIDIMGDELKWDAKRKVEEQGRVDYLLNRMDINRIQGEEWKKL